MFDMSKKNSKSKDQNRKMEGYRQIVVQTDYGSVTIVDLKAVYVGSNLLGQCGIAYKDSKYDYRVIYWSYDSHEKREYYKKLKEQLIAAYNRGDAIIEL